MTSSAAANILTTTEILTMSSAAPPRSRTGARKKQADEITYITVDASVAAVGSKRVALDKADGEPRAKRKRVDNSHTQQNIAATGSSTKTSNINIENSTSLIDFSTLPIETLHRYLEHYELVPNIYPDPVSASNPPAPAALLEPMRRPSPRTVSPASSIVTPANRPRRGRDSKEASRRRSSRLLEEEMRAGMTQVPVLADIGEFKNVLAIIAYRHFKETNVKEVETLASFMQTVEGTRSKLKGSIC